MNNSKNYTLGDLIGLRSIETLLNNLNEIYPFPSAIIDNEGKVLVAINWQDICVKFHRANPECELECIKSDLYITEHLHEANPAISYRCPNGMIDNAIPIIVGGRHLANFFTGQVFLAKPDLEFFKGQAQRYGFDEASYLAAVDKVPIWTEDQIKIYLGFIVSFVGMIAEIGEKNLKELEATQKIIESEERARRQRTAIADLAFDASVLNSDISESVKHITETIASTIQVARTSIWLLSEDSAELQCLTLYETETRQHSSGHILKTKDFPRYFSAISIESRIYAEDAQQDLRTNELTEWYLRPLGITSMLDAGIIMNGKLAGVICLEHTGEQRKWHPDEEAFVGTIAALAAQALQNIERKRVEERIKILSRSVEQNPVTIVITNRSGEIEYVNPKFCEVTGYSAEEVIGNNPRVLKSGEKPRDEYEFMWHTILSGREWRGEFHNKKKSGELFWEDAIISPILNDAGEITHFVAVKENVTEKKKMIEDLIAAKERAEEMNRLKSNFLSNMSHEFRTPMNGILGMASILKEDGFDPEDSIKMVDNIIVSGKRLMTTLDTILEFANLESARAGKEIAPVSILEVLRLIEPDIRGKAEKKGIAFSAETTDDSLFVQTGSKNIFQIMTHLLDNAIKFTSQGSVRVEISSVEIQERLFAKISVQDTGIGIPEEYHEIIFQEFKQLSEGYSRGYEGSGLGLSLIKKTVEYLKGKIEVVSEPGKGSAFTVFLPAVRVQPKLEKKAKPKNLSNKTARKAAPQTQPHVLIVEDNDVNELLVETYLREICIVDYAPDAATAIELSQKTQYSLILMDINLGIGMTGVEATQVIRQIEGYEETPIVAMTGYAMQSDKEEFLSRGLTHFLPKPFDKEDIVRLVQEILV